MLMASLRSLGLRRTSSARPSLHGLQGTRYRWLTSGKSSATFYDAKQRMEALPMGESVEMGEETTRRVIDQGLSEKNLAEANMHGKNKPDFTKKKLPAVMFVLGGPGAGKGTQCAKLAEKYGMLHLSAGDLLRAERDSGSANGNMINKILIEGGIVPVQITLDLLKEKVTSTQCSRFLIDGFPRNFDNLNGWLESSMDTICDVEGCIFFDCPESELEKRLLDRGKTSGRNDDNIESARKRFRTYQESTMPIVEYYRDKGMLLEVSGDQSVENVFRDLDTKMKPYIAEEVIHLTQQQMTSMSSGNWALYVSTCDQAMTSFETQVIEVGMRETASTGRASVRGIDAHKRYFDTYAGKKSEIRDKPLVRLLGKVAVISYVRSMEGKKYHETKIWSLVGNQWRAVHSHLDHRPA